MRMDASGKQTKMSFDSLEEYRKFISEGDTYDDESDDNCEADIDTNDNQKARYGMADVGDNQINGDRNVLESENGYWKMTGGRHPTPRLVSNMTLKARAKIVMGSHWWLDCTIQGDKYESRESVLLSMDDFLSSGSLKRALLEHGFEYYGNNNDTTQIMGLLLDQNPPEKIGTNTNGLHKINGRWVYVEGATIMDRSGPFDDVVYIDPNGSGEHTPSILDQEDLTEDDRLAIVGNLFRFNDSSVVYPILGYIGSCFIKPRLETEVSYHNPILLMQGLPSSGKTQTALRIIYPVFSIHDEISSIANNTKKTLAVNGSSSNMVPIAYDEYKEAVMNKGQRRDMDNMLLAAYDQTAMLRGNNGTTLHRYRFTAPHIIIGEMTLDSRSIKHRLIDVYFSHRKKEGKEEFFSRLIVMPLGSLGKDLLKFNLDLPDEQLLSGFNDQYAAVHPDLTDRFRDNAALLRTGLWFILAYAESYNIDLGSHDCGYDIIDNTVGGTMADARETNIDRIISDFSIMAHTPNGDGNWLRKGYHYEIRNHHLYIRMPESYARYREYAKFHTALAEPINKSSFLQQVKDTNYFRRHNSIRIGKYNCNGLKLDLTAIPQHLEVNFPE